MWSKNEVLWCQFLRCDVGNPDSQLELDGHLGLVLSLRGLWPRHPKYHGQLPTAR